ncbi:hypothetical protein [Leifsonia sp. AG29]|nr:hypothetical protein [Leifsonia sp. AG29]
MTPSATVDADLWTAPRPHLLEGRTPGWESVMLGGSRADEDVVILGYD